MFQSIKAAAAFGFVLFFISTLNASTFDPQQLVISDLHIANQNLGKKGISLLINAELSDYNKKLVKNKKVKTSSDLESAELFLKNNAVLFHYVYGKYDCSSKVASDINFKEFTKKSNPSDLQIIQSKKSELTETLAKKNYCQKKQRFIYYSYGSNFGRFDSLAGNLEFSPKALLSDWKNVSKMKISPLEADQNEMSLKTLNQLTTRKIQVAMEGFNLKARKPSSEPEVASKKKLVIAKNKTNLKHKKQGSDVSRVFFKEKKTANRKAIARISKNKKSSLHASASFVTTKKQKAPSNKL